MYEKRELGERLEREDELLKQQQVHYEEEAPAEYMQEFRRSKESVPNPVVPVIENHCSACYSQITVHDLAMLRRHILVTCSECFRKLYLPLSGESKKVMKQTTEWSLFIDGASRNNPGPSGAGIYLLKNGEPFLQQGYFSWN